MPSTIKRKARSKAAKGRRVRRSRKEVQALLHQIDTMVANGATIKDALKKIGVSYSNYNYWRKREGAPSKGGRGKGSPGKSSVVALLNEMTENRRQAESARKSVANLDLRFEKLKKQLEKASS